MTTPVMLKEYDQVAGPLNDTYTVRQLELPTNMIPVGLDVARNAIMYRHADRPGIVVATCSSEEDIMERLCLSERSRYLPLPTADLGWAFDDFEQSRRFRQLQNEAEDVMRGLARQLDEGDFIEVVCCLQCALKGSHSIKEIERELAAVAKIAEALDTEESI